MINVVSNIDLDNQTNFEFDYTLINKITNELTTQEIELIITDDITIRELNKEYRKIDKATDVLSFPLENMPNAPIGTVVISVDYIVAKAKEYGHSNDEEFALLYLHGLLHLLGYDHEVDNGEQRAKEKEIIEKLNLPKSLIIRNDD
ncbi:rRNA maturation RNase YbeY [Arcobacter sp. FWKO B]|uniref:rRNA maturation RNase YbeY n=1 Tax=Arcobacter sp. FWKO B TaxID=2593672 RepID=UPI001D196B7D|nr:rRNA maturation RNase YbeY [Arcobacter sp. FWKO B]